MAAKSRSFFQDIVEIGSATVHRTMALDEARAQISYPAEYSHDLKLSSRALSGASVSLRIAAQVCL